MAVTADFFGLGEAILGDVARPHMMTVIGPFGMTVSRTRVIRGNGHTCRLGRHCGKDGRSSEGAGKDNLSHDEPLFLSWSRHQLAGSRRFNHIGLSIMSKAETFGAPDR
jgi:hypothetical protein